MHSDQVCGGYCGIPAYTELNHLARFCDQRYSRLIALGDDDAGSGGRIFRQGEEGLEASTVGLQIGHFIIRDAPAGFIGDYGGNEIINEKKKINQSIWDIVQREPPLEGKYNELIYE
jgi:hypothetical protein